MKTYKLLIACIFLIALLGCVAAADNSAQNDVIMAINSSDALMMESDSEDEFNLSADENDARYAITYPLSLGDAENQNMTPEKLTTSPSDVTGDNKKTAYENQYYLFRGDCWTINNNFESSVAVTSETLTDMTVTGTFRTQNDLVGLYWNSEDTIKHPYISYGNRSDYSGVVLEFDYQMTGCLDLSRTTLTIAANNGEIYYLSMSQFIKKNHVTIDFNKLKLMPGNTYHDKNGRSVTVKKATKLDVKNLKYIMITLAPVNFVEDNTKLTITANSQFVCKIFNIAVTNGRICNEQPALNPHQYRLCEGYDDIYNLNPYRLCKEMRKLGYVDWVNLYIGASRYYEKSGNAGDVIRDMGFTNNRTEKMVLDANVPLNNAFKAWLDCYSRELKRNDVENIIISISMENLQCPQSWRQMDANGNFAITGWSPSTFIYSPCNEDVSTFMKSVCEACLDIVVKNGFNPILQMGEVWWWWNENELPNQSPCFYDNSTKIKYLAEHGTALPEYLDAWTAGYDNATMDWLNQQLVKYSDNISQVVRSDKYSDGLYIALFFLPSVTDTDRVPPMMRVVNYLYDAYTPYKLDILQIEDYDWVINESIHHKEAYVIGQELGFNQSSLHYFGGFVLYPEDASKYWPLIQKSLEDAIEHDFKEVYVWAGTQVRRDSKILGYDEYAIIGNLQLTNQPGIVTPIITAPQYAIEGESFTIQMRTNGWINGIFNVYYYENGEKQKLLASSRITNGYSSVDLSSNITGLNKLYLEFDYTDGEYHSVQEIYIVENSKNVTVNISGEVETGSLGHITLNAPKSANAYLYIAVDGNAAQTFQVKNGEFRGTIHHLSNGFHAVSVKYVDGDYVDGKFAGEAFYNTYTVNVGEKTSITASDLTMEYDSPGNLIATLKDSKNNGLQGKNITVTLNGRNYTSTTDKQGQVTLPVSLLPGIYAAEIYYSGDGTYLSSSARANVVVKKIATSITANNVNFIYGNQGDLTISLKDSKNNPISGKAILITLNNKDYALTTDKQGQAKLSIDLMPGEYTAKIYFKEDNVYLSSSANVEIAVNKIETRFAASDIEENLIITLNDGKNNPLKGKEILVTLNNITHTLKTDNNGQAILPINLMPGAYTARISFEGNEIYLPSSETVPIIVDKIATTMTAGSISFTYGNPSSLIITLKDAKNNPLKGKEITVSLNGMNHTIKTDSNGQAALPVDLLPGKYTAEILFKEDSVYLSSSANAEIVIGKVETSLKTNSINAIYGNPTNLVVTLKDSKNNGLKGKDITININGQNHTIKTDSNGEAALAIDLLPGKYSAKIYYREDSVYLSSTTDADINIDKVETSINAKSINFDYGDSTNLVITLKDDENKALAGKYVTISLNNKVYTKKVDANGQVKLYVNLAANRYIAKIGFAGDEVYKSSSCTAKIVVNKATPKITASSKSFKVKSKSKKVTLTLKNKNSPIKNAIVKLTVNKRTYTVKTNSKGVATFNLKLVKKGKFNAVYKFAGNSNFKSTTKSIKIIIN